MASAARGIGSDGPRELVTAGTGAGIRMPGPGPCRAAASDPMLMTLLMDCVIAAVVILPSVGLRYALDQKSLAGEDLT